MGLYVQILTKLQENVAIVSCVTLNFTYCVSTCVSLDKKIMSNGLFMTLGNLKIVSQSTDCHEFEEKDKSTNYFGTNVVLAYGRTLISLNVCKY